MSEKMETPNTTLKVPLDNTEDNEEENNELSFNEIGSDENINPFSSSSVFGGSSFSFNKPQYSFSARSQLPTSGTTFNFGSSSSISGTNLEFGKEIKTKSKSANEARLHGIKKLHYMSTEIPMSPLTLINCDKVVVNSTQLVKLKEKCLKSNVLVKEFSKYCHDQVNDIKRKLDFKVKMFEELVKSNKKLLLKRIEVFEKLNEKQKKDNFVITSKTVYTPLLTHCSDVFEIIFSYLNQKDLLNHVGLTSVFFYNIIAKKVTLKANILLKSLIKYPLDSILSRYKISSLTIIKKSTFVTAKKNDSKKLINIINASINHIKEIIIENAFVLISLCRDESMSIFGSKGAVKQKGSNGRYDIVSKMLDCKNLHSLNLQSYLFFPKESFKKNSDLFEKFKALKLRKLELGLVGMIFNEKQELFEKQRNNGPKVQENEEPRMGMKQFLKLLIEYFSLPNICLEELSFPIKNFMRLEKLFHNVFSKDIIELFYVIMSLKKLRVFKFFILPKIKLKNEFFRFVLGLEKSKIMLSSIKDDSPSFNFNNGDVETYKEFNVYVEDMLKFLNKEILSMKKKPRMKLYVNKKLSEVEYLLLNNLPIEIGLIESRVGVHRKTPSMLSLWKNPIIRKATFFNIHQKSIKTLLFNSTLKNYHIFFFDGNTAIYLEKLSKIIFWSFFSKSIQKLRVSFNQTTIGDNTISSAIKIISFLVSQNKPSLKEIIVDEKELFTSGFRSGSGYKSRGYGGGPGLVIGRVEEKISSKEREKNISELVEAMKKNKYIEKVEVFNQQF